jgi:hypothetical protein
MCRNDVLPFTVISVGAGGPSSYPSNFFLAESRGTCSIVTAGERSASQQTLEQRHSSDRVATDVNLICG